MSTTVAELVRRAAVTAAALELDDRNDPPPLELEDRRVAPDVPSDASRVDERRVASSSSTCRARPSSTRRAPAGAT